MLRDLRTICDLAHKLGLLESIPQIPLLRGKMPGLPVFLISPHRDDVVCLLASLRSCHRDPWDKQRRYTLVAMIVYTGLLRDDILDLLVADVDLAKGEISIRRRKGNKRSDNPVALTIHSDLKEILADWLPQTGGLYLFPGKKKVGRWFGSGSKKLRAYEEIMAACGGEAGIISASELQDLTALSAPRPSHRSYGLGSLVRRFNVGNPSYARR